MLGPETAVLTLQNGWGNADRIAGLVGQDRVLVGLTYHSGTLLGPGRVKHPGVGMTYVGELDGRETPRLLRVAEVLRAAGFETTITPRIHRRDLEEACAQRLHAADCGAAPLLRPRTRALRRRESGDGRDPRRSRSRRHCAEASSLDYDERWGAIISLLKRAVGG